MKLLIIYLFLGIITGVLYGVFKNITFVFKNNFIVQIITDIMFILISAYLFWTTTQTLIYGEIRLHLLVIFIMGAYLERKTLGKLFAKLFFMLYNWVSKLINKFKLTKFGKLIFK